jgi:hypothetical protein
MRTRTLEFMEDQWNLAQKKKKRLSPVPKDKSYCLNAFPNALMRR